MTERSVKKRKIKKQRGGEEIVIDEPYKTELPNIVKNLDTQNDPNLQKNITEFQTILKVLTIIIKNINYDEKKIKEYAQANLPLLNGLSDEKKKLKDSILPGSVAKHKTNIDNYQSNIAKNQKELDYYYQQKEQHVATKPILENILQELVKTIRLQKIIVDINTHNKWTIQDWPIEQRIVQYKAIVKSMNEIRSTLLKQSNLVTRGGGIDNITRYNTFLANGDTSAKVIIQEFSEIAKIQPNEYGITQNDVKDLSLALEDYNGDLEKSKNPRSRITKQMVDNSEIALEMKYNELRHKLKLINYFNIADNIIPGAINPETININELFTKYDKYMQLGYAEILKK